MDAETYADYKQLTVDLFHYFFNYGQKNHGSIKTKYSSLENLTMNGTSIHRTSKDFKLFIENIS
jgi:hypothetical protein